MPLTFNRDFDARHGEAVTVAPLVRRVTAPNASPFTFQGTNTFLIGRDELSVLDPGPDDPRHRDALIRAIGPASVRRILISHTHSDHVAGARKLQERIGAPILAARQPLAPSAETGIGRLDAAADAGFSPDEFLDDGAVLKGDEYRLEAIATPGHAADHLAFSLADSNVLFSGDHVMGWSTSVVAPPDGNMGDYIASLDRLLARPESFYLPAHGGAISNARDYVRALKAHRAMREAAILDRLRQGDRAISGIVTRIYKDVDPALHTAAALSTLAHLQDLVARGIVLADGVPALGSDYSLGGSAASSSGSGSGSGAGGAGVATAED